MGAVKHSELLDYLAESVREVLTGQTNISQECVRRAEALVKSRMAFVWANSVIYIPKQLHSQNLSRNQKIFTDFDGDNHPELSEKYGLSIQRIYAIVKQMKEEHVKQHQGTLFDLPHFREGAEKSSNERPYHILEDIIAHTSSCLQAHLALDRKQADGLGEAIAQHFSQHRHGLFGYIRSGTTQQPSDIKQGCLFDISTKNVEQD
ncbi:hypothetical protein CE195_08385 [Sodalis-like symbiont of Philaenus spumarius]|nr:hypothetical protein CE195_08385 [Sodalis-like symbiont of Philaenus spumarius]